MATHVIQRVTVAVLTGIVTMAAGAVVVLIGPALSAELTGRAHSEALQEGPVLRHYLVYRPARLEAPPGLVLDLNAAHTNGFLQEVASRFDSQADRRGWIVAYPDAVFDGWEPYGCCHHEGVDDVAFIGHLIDRLEATDRVDPDRVYVTGLSRGGMMAYRLACGLSSRLAAIAPVEGNMADEHGQVSGVDCRPDRPVSILAVHGSADTEVPIAGGGRFAPMSAVIDRWRELDGCARSSSARGMNLATITSWRCQEGTQVESVVVRGSGHLWPGTPFSSLPWGPSASLDASPLIAEFFAAHHRAPAAR